MTKDLEARVNSWRGSRPLAQLLTDLPTIFPPAPSLMLTDSPTPAEVKKAYMKAVRVIHPDKLRYIVRRLLQAKPPSPNPEDMQTLLTICQGFGTIAPNPEDMTRPDLTRPDPAQTKSNQRVLINPNST